MFPQKGKRILLFRPFSKLRLCYISLLFPLLLFYIFSFGGGSRIGEIRERTNRQVHIVQFPVLDSNSKNYFFFVVCVSLSFFLCFFVSLSPLGFLLQKYGGICGCLLGIGRERERQRHRENILNLRSYLSIYLSIYFRNRFLQTICIVFDEEKNKVCKEFESQLGSLHVQVTYFIYQKLLIVGCLFVLFLFQWLVVSLVIPYIVVPFQCKPNKTTHTFQVKLSDLTEKGK